MRLKDNFRLWHMANMDVFLMLDALFERHISRVSKEITLRVLGRNTTSTNPSTGFVGVALALQLCDQVDVYGLVPSLQESGRSPARYWESGSGTVAGYCAHDCRADRAI